MYRTQTFATPLYTPALDPVYDLLRIYKLIFSGDQSIRLAQSGGQ